MSRLNIKQVAGALGLLAAGGVAAVAAQRRTQPDLIQEAARVRQRYQQQVAKAQGQPDADAGFAGVATKRRRIATGTDRG